MHDPKVCSACKRELPASSFPLWPSSADGRRHQCKDCVQVEQSAQAVKRTEEREQSHKSRNERLKENGYTWAIRTPDGRYVTPHEAERELEQKEWDERHDDEIERGL